MPTFKYTALRPTGEAVAGTLKAKSAGQARVELSSQLLRATGLQEQRSWTQFEVMKSRIKPKQLMYLSRQLAAGSIPRDSQLSREDVRTKGRRGVTGHLGRHRRSLGVP